METLANNYITYAKKVNNNREIILVEGKSAMLCNLEPLAVTIMHKSIERHRNIIDVNINRYGKIKKVC